MIEAIKHRNLLKIAFSRWKVPQELLTEREREGDINRAGGNVICEKCGLEYVDHPRVEGMEFLAVTCDWRVWKL